MVDKGKEDDEGGRSDGEEEEGKGKQRRRGILLKGNEKEMVELKKGEGEIKWKRRKEIKDR